MSILEADKIDIIATRPGTSIVRLIIADHLNWDDLEEHARLLQDKVNGYLAFIESGQLQHVSTPVIPDSPELQIMLATQYPPTDAAKDFLVLVRAFLDSVGVKFDWEVRASAAR